MRRERTGSRAQRTSVLLINNSVSQKRCRKEGFLEMKPNGNSPYDSSLGICHVYPTHGQLQGLIILSQLKVKQHELRATTAAPKAKKISLPREISQVTIPSTPCNSVRHCIGLFPRLCGRPAKLPYLQHILLPAKQGLTA